MALCLEADEFAASITPFLLRQVREESKHPVLYLGPAVQVYGDLTRIARLADEHGIVLAPRLASPLPEGSKVDELMALTSGVFDRDVIAVGEGSDRFLEWWSDREGYDSVDEADRVDEANRGLSTHRASLGDAKTLVARRWLDLTPAYFNTHILRDAETVASYWNLGSRDLTVHGADYRIDGSPLWLFNFSGYDPFKPWLLNSRSGVQPRVLLSERPALVRLCAEYRTRLLEAGYAEAEAEPYRFDSLPNGMRIIPTMRTCYHLGLVDREGSGVDPPPQNPFEPGGAADLIAWFNGPGPDPTTPGLTRYLHSVWRSRSDLLIAFPELPGTRANAFLRWVEKYGRDELQIPDELIPPRQSPHDPTFHRPLWKSSKGFNVSGYLAAGVGLGVAARGIVRAAKATGYPVSEYDSTMFWPSQWRFSSAGERASDPQPAALAEHDFNIVCVNADWLPQFAKGMGRSFFAGRVTAGVWFWETEELPQKLAGSARFLDEVWTGSRYTRAAIERSTRTPVLVVPIPVELSPVSITTRAEAGMPEGYLFFFSFDMGSVTARKNPLGLVEAYTRAFAPDEGPKLLIKTIRGAESFRSELEELRMAIDDRPDISVIDGYLPVSERDALMELCDCYVSLHRSEGLGLTIAEAMARGKPVITTGYSGNMDFTTEENSYLVDYSLIPIGVGHDPYPPTQRWADPDLDHAAQLLRHVYTHPAEAAAKGQRGAALIAERYSVEACSRFLLERLARANGWTRLGWYRRQASRLTERGVRRQLRERASAAKETLL